MNESKVEMIPCLECEGSGRNPKRSFDSHLCAACNGEGKIISMTIRKNDNVVDFSKFKKQNTATKNSESIFKASIPIEENEFAEFAPLLPFEDQSAAFTNGFELGTLFQILFHMKPDEWIGPCHSKNKSMLIKLAAITNYSIEINEIEYVEWIEVKFIRLKNQPKPRIS